MRYPNGKAVAALGVVLLVLGLAVTAQAAGGGGDHNKWLDFLWRVLNFAVLAAILYYFLKKPLVNFFTNRRETVRTELEELENKRQEVERAYKESEAKMATLEASTQEIVAEAVRQGEVEKERILADAERAAANIKRQAEMAIQHELTVSTFRLKSEVADEAARTAEELVRKNLQPADEAKMIAGYLDKVGGVQ
ncbi:MAG: ATP synthase F0 subunit B [Desulfurivibrio sp.]|nr:ATP synthase F0 subunit B [Desulfurivibrio sp.]